MGMGISDLMEGNSDIKSKKGRGTIREWLTCRFPNFDPAKQKVFLNDVQISDDRFDSQLAPLDVIKVRQS